MRQTALTAIIIRLRSLATFRTNVFVDLSFDRAGHRRRDAAWLARLAANPGSRLLPLLDHKPLLAETAGGAPRLVWLAADLLNDYRAEGLVILLGQDGETGLFAIDVGSKPGGAPPGFLEEALEDGHPLNAHGSFGDLRSVGALLEARDAHLAAYARGLTWWHARHGHCGVCGAPTVPCDAGHRRTCTNPNCGVDHFPRSDPAVIMLIHHGDMCLLGRQRVWPPGVHSVLAGFVEPGESLEAAVQREVAEETGIRVRDPRYHSSQPWPFPQSLMLGFTAEALSTEITLEDGELEAAGWYSRAELRALPDTPRGPGAFSLPRKTSIARRLVEDWLAQG